MASHLFCFNYDNDDIPSCKFSNAIYNHALCVMIDVVTRSSGQIHINLNIELTKINICLFFMKVWTAFHHMVMSDVLVIYRNSKFSLTAAILSSGQIYKVKSDFVSHSSKDHKLPSHSISKNIHTYSNKGKYQ